MFFLAHPDFTRPFTLSTDASLDGIGAVLSQVQEGETLARPIAFASKSLSQSQKNYPAQTLPLLVNPRLRSVVMPVHVHGLGLDLVVLSIL